MTGPRSHLYWLTCPLAVGRVARLEGAGGIKRLERMAEVDPDFGTRLAEAHESYEGERTTLLPGDASNKPSGGVGGTRTGIKCLHAHYAHTRAGGDNPVGELVQDLIEPLDCTVPCVLEGEMNPEWVAPP